VAKGIDLLRLSWNPQGQLSLVDSVDTLGIIRAIRSTTARTYVVTDGIPAPVPIRVALESPMRREGSHDVGNWVTSEQSGRYRARLLPLGLVEVAWVN
jgi:hypothetical protein